MRASYTLAKTRLNLMYIFLDQKDPKSKYFCKNELIHFRDLKLFKINRSR